MCGEGCTDIYIYIYIYINYNFIVPEMYARAYTMSVEIMIKHSVGGGVVHATVGRCVRDATMLFLYLLIYA